MVGVLIRMKIAVLRNSVRGMRATWVLTGGLVGLAVAAATVTVTTLDVDKPGTLVDLLAVVFAIWTLGWMLGPVFGGDPVLRAEHFALLPVSRARLALGLLASGFVGLTTVITLVAFTALVVFATRLGGVPVLVAIPALVGQLALVVVLSRLTARVFGALARSRAGAAVTAVLTAALLVLAQSGWVVLIALDTVLVTGFSREFSIVVRALPSSWALMAVEASARGDWLWTIAPLTALAVLIAGLLGVWARQLGPPRLARQVVRGSTAERAAPAGWTARGATAAVYVKEMRTWLRDPLRMQSLVVAPAFAVLTGLLPLLFGSTALFPFVGAVTAVMGAVTCSNLYGQDGTALWLTLLMPGTGPADVRGRQFAWLTVFGPISLVATVVGAALHGDPALWPWALAATFAVLGGGAGLVPLVAMDQLVPGPDPQRTTNSPLEHGDMTGPSFVMLFAVLGTAVPAVGVVLAGKLLDEPLLAWAGVPVGVLTGAISYVRLGATAAHRLRDRGPELLYLMRAGKEHRARPGVNASVLTAMPRHKRSLLWASLLTGVIALFPQSLVPIGMKLSGGVERVWFLALYLPEPLQWPTLALMILLAIASFGLAAKLYLSELRTARNRLGGLSLSAPDEPSRRPASTLPPASSPATTR